MEFSNNKVLHFEDVDGNIKTVLNDIPMYMHMGEIMDDYHVNLKVLEDGILDIDFTEDTYKYEIDIDSIIPVSKEEQNLILEEFYKCLMEHPFLNDEWEIIFSKKEQKRKAKPDIQGTPHMIRYKPTGEFVNLEAAMADTVYFGDKYNGTIFLTDYGSDIDVEEFEHAYSQELDKNFTLDELKEEDFERVIIELNIIG